MCEEEEGVQQVHAETDPKPGKEAEDDHHHDDDDSDDDSDYTLMTPPGWLSDPSFIDPAVQGGALPRSDASSPESGAPIGPGHHST